MDATPPGSRHVHYHPCLQVEMRHLGVAIVVIVPFFKVLRTDLLIVFGNFLEELVHSSIENFR